MTIRKLCYECYDDHKYATVGFEGAAEAEEYVATLIETGAVVCCPQCGRTVDYGRER